ncbi:DUF192 domain-containing protein [Treponema lecithinolyticum]|uniref:ACR n=1 Tax=Treponema lecithinolyticum ATCC 700332 TaxID=1321815 RepID=A0ABN0NZ56_TRELE|nr:DUF192 domain-containing protein [Treponema lecithinolyticum]ERJ93332.1 putative ACR [Treponema lecithinolyticum ATCC 700332]
MKKYAFLYSRFLCIFPAFLLFFLAFSVSCTAQGKYKLEKKELTITRSDGTTVSIQAELAKTEKQRNFGYMERTHIPKGTGMLFIFEQDQILRFWMKNTPSALSIAFIDSRGTIRELFDMTPYSLANVSSTVSVRYALEVPQGWFSANGIVPGCTVSLP